MNEGFGAALSTAWSLVIGFDARLAQIVGLSLGISSLSCVLAAGVGMTAGAWLAVARFPGHRTLVAVLNTLLALPSVVVGLAVYLLLSRAGPLGSLGILFTPAAMVIAQTVLVLPVVAALTRQLVADAWHGNGEQLRSMGAAPFTAALLLLVHERLALVTIALTAFGRAISEVGAVMIVGGNIDGVTRVMTTAIALETSKGDLPLALGLGFVLLAVVGAINALIALVQRRQGTHEAAAPAAALPAAA
ncbi:MAG: ABC transporter permease [Aquincola sp.]|nr:ABC transporter permease [Aquincola sp.]MDH4288482.1 ABC transporter permease [Aquincola sp.]MDH5330238.1 ABC transporter permease [Aquincola sp.]